MTPDPTTAGAFAGTGADEPVCLADIERAAFATVPKDVWDFVAGGSGRELTLAANRSALDGVHLVPRILRDVSGCTAGTTLLGRGAALPLAVAPVAYHRLLHPEGELATARAARRAGVPFTIGTLSSYPLEEVAAAAGRSWFQLYWLRDEARLFDLVARAEEAGCEALMLTVDVPWMGRRLRDIRNRFSLPADVTAANLSAGTGSEAHTARPGASAVAAHTSVAMTEALTWEHVERLRARTRLPLILKGILDPEDARLAADHGVDALVVSNHGGRQLDGAVPAATMLPAVREAVGDRVEVLFDSGIRTGTDVLKALALGASGVLLGRPLLWGLAVGGEAGADTVLRLLAEEIRDALGLAGCDSPAAARLLRTVRADYDRESGSAR
ncbi:alpha-hydroxy acid oxidase [Kitasatospora sp. NPDC048239]|uniref:alpha-hydroxy acid oxidase n=1 Tax=Kitasatospora sp. NPDC048239 TaxID=3364046 RepID=UPI0037167D06